MRSGICWTAAATLLSLIPSTFAQTHSDCDPTKQDGCAPDPALGTYAQFNWTKTAADDKVWEPMLGSVDYSTDGAQFTIARKLDAPTLRSAFYFFWGRVSIIMKAAPGDGIVSSVMLMSDNLDEIDWEWIGGNTTHVQSNFFGKGDNSTYDRAVWHPVDNTLNEHNYTIVWSQPQIEWWIDNQLTRTLKYDDPLAKSKGANAVSGDRYPQTPMSIRVGNWAGGDPDLNNEGTVEWANNGQKGGRVDYKKGPYSQTVIAVEVDDFSSGKEYTYSDKTGDFRSIKATAGNSTIAERINHQSGIANKFNSLSPAVKIGIAIGAAVVAGILLILLMFCCIKNRREGRREKAIADAQWEANLQELQQYKRAMVAEEEIHPRAGYI